jgi:hypothetical protein
MILPERVFGRSPVNSSDAGFAIGEIIVATWSRRSVASTVSLSGFRRVRLYHGDCSGG